MTARSLRPEKLVLTGEVMRVLKSEGLVCAEVVIGGDGKGYIRFAPEAEFEGLVVHREEITGEQAAEVMAEAPLPRFEAAHDRGCHCADCVPCVHHPGEDCDCYCRFCEGCGPGNCDFWVGPLLQDDRRYDPWDR